jgi:hydroxyacylglutathione hydrolase
VLTIAFPAQAFDTNCYVLAPGAGEECLIVDPGIGVEETLREVLTEHRLRPAAVLLTHGHVDHVYSVTPVCGADTAAYIHADDRYRLHDLLGQSNPGLVAMLEQQFGAAATWTEPTDVVEITDGTRLALAGMEVDVLHAPGHTEGSVMFGIDGVPDGIRDHVDVDRTMVTGDVLFAGSVGRTDLPGGDHAALIASIKDKLLPLGDDIGFICGHGPGGRFGEERRTNPFLV